MPHRARVYIVTGAASGIGLATAHLLSERGAAGVCLVDLDASRLAEAADRLGAGTALPLVGDVRDTTTAERAIDATVETFGRLDGLVNSAGLVRLGPAIDLEPAEVSRELEVNVTGTFVMSQAVARHLQDQGGGAIVNVASNCGKVGYANMAGYNASKSAVISLTRSFATEWASAGINVNAVCPGGVDTPMLADVAAWLAPRVGSDPDELLAAMAPSQLGRLVRPEEVARVVLFLLSDEATIIRGQAINVDGGDTPY